MEKKYNHQPEENKNIEEPALIYKRARASQPQYSVEELQARIEEATLEIRNGDFLTEDELDDFILS
ncbi:MAG: hypothetical protein LUG98_00200 [Tannerellaceae bacterium]|nr:hypothetical protein [Tannerellaceae bacterium]